MSGVFDFTRSIDSKLQSNHLKFGRTTRFPGLVVQGKLFAELCCWCSFRGFAKKRKFQKSEITMEVGGLVQVSLGIFFCGK